MDACVRICAHMHVDIDTHIYVYVYMYRYAHLHALISISCMHIRIDICIYHALFVRCFLQHPLRFSPRTSFVVLQSVCESGPRHPSSYVHVAMPCLQLILKPASRW